MINFLALFCLLCQCAFGWWDEGHQLVAAVAKSQLTKDEVESIESMLGYWAADYPGTSSLINAAIWPDHLKCRSNSAPGCEHVVYFDGIETFSPWHYVSLPYNPQEIQTSKLFQNFPLPETGAVWALTTLIGYARNDMSVPEIDKDPPFTFWPSRRSATDEMSTSNMWRRLTTFSWNFRLRMLLHILGDLHQPLHAIAAVSKVFPEGDRGGSLIRIVSERHSKTLPRHVDNLHALWDTAGGYLTGEWPQSAESYIESKVPELLKSFPRNSTFFKVDNFNYGHRLPVDVVSFREIAEESYTLAVQSIYTSAHRPFLHQNLLNAHAPLQVDDAYRAEVRYLATARIVLAGYRLAYHLKRMAALLEDPEKPDATPPPTHCPDVYPQLPHLDVHLYPTLVVN